MLISAGLSESFTNNRQPEKVDKALIYQIGQGNMAAFQELYEETRHSIYGFVLSITKNTADAEDVLQDTYLKIQGGARFYQSQGKPMAWIFTIARNLALMKLRENKKTDYLDPENPVSDPFSHIENSNDRIVLQSVLQILDEEERQIVTLHAVAGLKHRETAKLLNLALPTVLSKYRRALHKLEQKLKEEDISL